MNTTRDTRQADDGAGVPQEAWDRGFVQVHRAWCDELIVELRLADVPGAVIGDRLAEVETHCIESGETPAEAFGDAADYARDVAAESERERPGEVWTVAALSVAQVMALLVGTSAVPRWARGLPWEYNAIQVVCMLLAGGMLVMLPVLVGPIVRRPWVVGAPYAMVFTALAVGAAFAGQWELPVLLSLPASVVAVGLFAIILVLSVLEFLALRRDDPVTTPLGGPVRGSGGRPGRNAGPYIALVLPVAYVLLGVFGWLAA
ncbi:hypothetical protein FCK90_08065 [Kocuria coralli]|uniref:DUF1129 domain-containing protein n=1 Tax=Kocuria coralli TaxID=1461025 RepID=A0A5J5KZ60_9MICC|nr:hypothetical protein [Kocuria coralli]KAA9394195.1 hypothetical protein FCK90_08065 [Kocuria coralli]